MKNFFFIENRYVIRKFKKRGGISVPRAPVISLRLHCLLVNPYLTGVIKIEILKLRLFFMPGTGTKHVYFHSSCNGQ